MAEKQKLICPKCGKGEMIGRLRMPKHSKKFDVRCNACYAWANKPFNTVWEAEEAFRSSQAKKG